MTRCHRHGPRPTSPTAPDTRYRALDDHHLATCEHTDPTAPGACAGCLPCPEPHCVLDGRTHLDPAHPLTCPDCLSKVRQDLTDTRWLARHLRWQASRGENLRTPSAPLPGGDAMVMMTRHAPTTRTTTEHDDLRTVLGVLLDWDQQLRRALGHRHLLRPSVTGVSRYLTEHLTRWAQDTTGTYPDWQAFARAAGDLRRTLERVLHDEQTPELGVACFECGDRLVRRWGNPKPCGHRTPAKDHVHAVRRRATAATDWIRTLATYPELGQPWDREYAAAHGPSDVELAAARQPCAACAEAGQGGITDPSAGQSWECPGCRKAYTPGEYATAVRRDLLERGPDGDGWTHVNMAAEAASTLTGFFVAPATVRRWMDRGQVVAVCSWRRGQAWGPRLVLWPSVAEVASAAAERQARRMAERAELERQRTAFRAALEAGEDATAAGARLGIHPGRVKRFVGEWEAEHQDGAA